MKQISIIIELELLLLPKITYLELNTHLTRWNIRCLGLGNIERIVFHLEKDFLFFFHGLQTRWIPIWVDWISFLPSWNFYSIIRYWSLNKTHPHEKPQWFRILYHPFFFFLTMVKLPSTLKALSITFRISAKELCTGVLRKNVLYLLRSSPYCVLNYF